MLYKTITLELLHAQPALYERLRSGKMLLSALDSHSADLKLAHEQWISLLRKENPGSDPSLISAQAMELAIQDLSAHLSCEPAPTEDEARSLLDEAMPHLQATSAA